MSREHVGGLDALRCLATLLVAWQHAASVAGFYETTQWRGISPGQSGVAIFCAIAGLLAGLQSHASLGPWLLRRAARIYPAYWLATIAAFALVLVFGGKPLTGWLFASQMLGTGYFTHGGELINVVSWFVSLILLCYVLFAIGRRLDQLSAVMLFSALVALTLVVLRMEVMLSRHVLVFTLAVLLVRYPRSVCSAVVLLLGAGLYSPDPQLCYPAIGLGSVLLAKRVGAENLVFRKGAQYSYEFFLIHGIFLVGVTRFLGINALAIAAALLAAALGAVVLHFAQMPVHAGILRLQSSLRLDQPKEPLA